MGLKIENSFFHYEDYEDQDITPLGRVILVVMLLIPINMMNLYTLNKVANIFRSLWATKCYTEDPIPGGLIREGEEPTVTIQICSYNEAPVIKETIDAACSVDWPSDRLHVQILDDSTDVTVDIIERCAADWREKGISCERLTRECRVGYKAGCLKTHSNRVKGEFLAMFDADHHCDPQFLRRAVVQFYDKNGDSLDHIGLVQAPWDFHNDKTNILTRYDSLMSDNAHIIEQIGRSAVFQCFSFNGTGGIWRTEAIEAGGGWSDDTLVEDLDLSYYVYMAGYKFIYIRDLPQKLELPTGVRAHIQQKHRWTKGYLQVARKSLWKIIKHDRIPLRLKIEAFFHFTEPVTYFFCLWLILLMPIAAWFMNIYTVGLFTVIFFNPTIPAITSFFSIYGKPKKTDFSFWKRSKRLIDIPLLSFVGLGMTVFQVYACLDGLLSNDATFLRTPKEGNSDSDSERGMYEDDLDDDDSSGKGSKSSGNGDSSSVSKTHTDPLSVSTSSSSSVLSRNRKFLKDLSLGLLGIAIALYFILSCIILYRRKRRSGGIIQEFIMIFVFTVPACGLLYIHSIFLHALLKAKMNKWRNEVKELAGANRRAGRPNITDEARARFDDVSETMKMDESEFASSSDFSISSSSQHLQSSTSPTAISPERKDPLHKRRRSSLIQRRASIPAAALNLCSIDEAPEDGTATDDSGTDSASICSSEAGDDESVVRVYQKEIQLELSYHDKDNKVHYYSVAAKYSGPLWHGLPHGQIGILRFENGDMYLGGFESGKMHGLGTFVQKGHGELAKTILKGEFANNQFPGDNASTASVEEDNNEGTEEIIVFEENETRTPLFDQHDSEETITFEEKTRTPLFDLLDFW